MGESLNRPRALPPSREGGFPRLWYCEACGGLATCEAVDGEIVCAHKHIVATFDMHSVSREVAATPEPSKWTAQDFANARQHVTNIVPAQEKYGPEGFMTGRSKSLILDAIANLAAASRDGSEGREQEKP